MIKVNNFGTLETKIVEQIHTIDLTIELYKILEFYDKIPAQEYLRKKHIQFYIDTFLKYNTGECQTAKDIIARTSEDIKNRDSTYTLK